MNRAATDFGKALSSAPGRGGGFLARVVVLLGLAAASVAFAADDSKIIFPGGATRAAAPATNGGGSGNMLTLVVALLLAAVGGWFVWRNRRATGVPGGGRALAIEETRSLGNRQYLVVASYEGRKFLLGVCPGRIDMLAPLHGTKPGEGELR